MDLTKGDAIVFPGFTLSIAGRQFSDAPDYWDGNWLLAECVCTAEGRAEKIAGPFIHLSEVSQLASTFEKLCNGEIETTDLHFIEPEFELTLRRTSPEHFTVSVRLQRKVPGPSQDFFFTVVEAELLSAIEKCKAILAKYPLRDPE